MKYELNTNDYEILSSLGKCCGHIGIVLLARHKRGHLLAVKKFDLEKADFRDVLDIQEEILTLKKLQHVNILSHLSCYAEGQAIYVVNPICGYGSCTDLMMSHFPNGLPELAICYILRDILSALAYLHKKGYIHRAIRASHILISSTGNAMLTGFRYAIDVVENGKRRKQVHSFPISTVANLNWLSPEVLEQNLDGYNERSDVYSVGITAVELANGCVPFSDVSVSLMLTEKVRGCMPQLIDCTTYPDYNHINRDTTDNCRGAPPSTNVRAVRCFTNLFHQFSAICLMRDPDLRPSAAQLQMHSFFKQLKQKNIPTLPQLLHPVMALNEDTIQADADDVHIILSDADNWSDTNTRTVNWDF